jgi:hypothetical protein
VAVVDKSASWPQVRVARLLLGADSGNGHHSSCFPFFGAVGKQEFWMAVGAERGCLDAFLGDAGGQELLAIRFYQV